LVQKSVHIISFGEPYPYLTSTSMSGLPCQSRDELLWLRHLVYHTLQVAAVVSSLSVLCRPFH